MLIIVFGVTEKAIGFKKSQSLFELFHIEARETIKTVFIK